MKRIITLVLVAAMLLALGSAFTSCDVQGEQGIQGEKGDKGDQGIQGIQGEKGDKGDQGAQGVKGDPGEKGDPGATIAKVEFDAQGRLVITLTNGTVLEPITIPQKEEHLHTYGEWRVVEASTCTEDGFALRFCAECHDTQAKSLPHTGHLSFVAFS